MERNRRTDPSVFRTPHTLTPQRACGEDRLAILFCGASQHISRFTFFYMLLVIADTLAVQTKLCLSQPNYKAI